MNDCSVPAGGPRECASRWMYRPSLFCVFAGLAVMIGGFIVRSVSVVDEMSASASRGVQGARALCDLLGWLSVALAGTYH